MRVGFDRNSNRQYLDLQVLLAIAYGVQLGRQRRLEALEILAEQCVRATCASSAAIAIVRDNELHTLAYFGTLAQHLSLRSPLGESLVARCVRTGTPQIRYESPLSQASEIQSIIYWPLLGNDGGRGVFALFERVPYAFTEDDLEMVAKFVRGIHGVLGWQREAILPDLIKVNQDAMSESLADTGPTLLGIEAPRPAELSAANAPLLEDESSARLIVPSMPVEEEPVKEYQSGSEAQYVPAEVEEGSSVWRFATTALLILAAAAGIFYANRLRQRAHPADATQTTVATSPKGPAVSTAPAPTVQPNVPASTEPPAMLLKPVGIPDGKVTVEAIAVRRDAGHDLVALRLSGQTTYKVVRLSKPDRIFIDFPQVAPSRLTQRIPPASTVLGVRMGFDEKRGLRIVLDLSQRADYLIVHSADGKSIVLTVSPVGTAD